MEKNNRKTPKNANNSVKNGPNSTAAAVKSVENGAARVSMSAAKRRTLIIVSATLLVLAIAAGVVFGVIHSINNRRFDFLSGDISKYIKLSREDYAGYEIDVTVPEPTERELEERILATLAKNKSKTPLYNGYYVTPSTPIQNGWVLKIWYRGYTIGEGGEELEFDGGCNFSSSTPAELEIGSGDFVSGFELGLIGNNITEYSKFTSTTSGRVESHDIIVVSMTAMYPDGKSEILELRRIDLADDDVDTVWGEGFKEAMIGLDIGSVLDDNPIVTEMEGGTALYTDIKVHSAVRPTVSHTDGSYQNDERVTVEYITSSDEGEKTNKVTFTLNEYVIGGNFGGELRELMYTLLGGGEVGVAKDASFTDEDTGITYSSPRVVSVDKREDKPIVVEAYFPYDYSEESLRGKTAYFDVYVTGAIVYEAPSLTDGFITETLKLTVDELSEFAGDTLTEKYRDKVRSELYAEYEAKMDAQKEELVWAHISEALEYDPDALPEGDVKAVKAQYTADFMAYYEYYKKQYTSLADAAMDYFGIKNGSLWKDYIDALAREDIAEKMVLYYISREEGFLPERSELERLYNEKVDELLVSYLSQNHCKRENYDSDEAYNAAVAEYREAMVAEYTRDSIFDALCYEIAMPKIIALAIVNKP